MTEMFQRKKNSFAVIAPRYYCGVLFRSLTVVCLAHDAIMLENQFLMKCSLLMLVVLLLCQLAWVPQPLSESL